MKNYGMGNSTPEAYITKNKQRVKQHERTVYLDNGDNFEIELYNPTDKKVLAKISLDGKLISNAGIVLRPAERVFLDRYIDSNNKFLYSTYEVKNTEVNLNAIRSNGDLEVKFYYETIFFNTNNLYNGVTYIDQPKYNYRHYDNTVPDPNIFYCSSVSGQLTNSACGTTVTSNNCATLTSSVSANFQPPQPKTKRFTRRLEKSSLNTIETGTVEKGGKSEQSFQTVNATFNTYASHYVTWKILPRSQKNITIDDIREYCTNCGTRRKQNYKFCPKCGNKF